MYASSLTLTHVYCSWTYHIVVIVNKRIVRVHLHALNVHQLLLFILTHQIVVFTTASLLKEKVVSF